MDLRRYLIAPHEKPPQQPARHDTPILQHQQQQTSNTLDPRLAHRIPAAPAVLLKHEHSALSTTASHTHVGDYEERIGQIQQVQMQLQQQLQQQSRDKAITREQVISGLTTYPDILAAILRSGQIPSQNTSDCTVSAQHPDTSPQVSQPTTMTVAQRTTVPLASQTTTNATSAPIPAISPTRSTNSVQRAVQPTPPIPQLCFWQYHHGNCTHDPASPNYHGIGLACPYLHSTEGMQEVRVQQGKVYWHRGMGDCGLELCKFSSNYKPGGTIELELREKKTLRDASEEGKNRTEAMPSTTGAAVARSMDGDEGDGVVENRAEDLDAVNLSSQSILEHEEQIDQDTASVSLSPVLPAIPTSPRAGRYAKGSRRQQPLASSPTPSKLKRKADVLSQNTLIPASKKSKPSTLAPPIQTTDSAISIAPLDITPLSKKATKRLKRLNKKSEAIVAGTVVATSPAAIAPANPVPTPRPSLTNKSFMVKRQDHNKPHHTTCFAWYHGSCSRKGRYCKELHALTHPPSFVVAPEGYVHEGGVCGLEWCGGDWRGDQEEDEDAVKEVGNGEVEEVMAEDMQEADVDKASVGGDYGKDIEDEEVDERESADEMVD